MLDVEKKPKHTRNRIYERAILLRFLGIILKVFILQVSVYNNYISNQLVTVKSKEENFCPKYVREFGLWKYFNSFKNFYNKLCNTSYKAFEMFKFQAILRKKERKKDRSFIFSTTAHVGIIMFKTHKIYNIMK